MLNQKTKHFLVDVLGIDLDSVSHRERWLSMLGGFISISLIIYINLRVVHDWGVALIVASMGASAVLLFAVPHGKLSQPWPVAGGHLLSALIGVACYRWIPHLPSAAGLAVGLSIGAMHYLRCIHPPGGATALSFVIGSPSLHALGYQYLMEPVLINVVIILGVAVVFNLPFVTRRYPQGLQHLLARDRHHGGSLLDANEIQRADVVRAIEQMDIVVDINDDDLVELFHLAKAHAKQRHLSPDHIVLGHYFTNGGEHWSVRRIVDESADHQQVIYRVVAGNEKTSTGINSRDEFARWARFEVERQGSDWRRVETTTRN
ncbi:MAG: HPP family protein [Gammaproteobacteria bacterium]|nr:HPP family protein [Gammaproteobacteria bacterium]